MRKIVLISFVILSAAVQMTHAQKQAVIKLTETTLMHEMRATPYPLDKAVVNDRAVSFQWPLRSDMNSQDSPLDGFEHKVKKIDKTKITYRSVSHARRRRAGRRRRETPSRHHRARNRGDPHRTALRCV